MKTSIRIFSALVLSSALFLTACEKGDNNAKTTVNVRLTDSPADYNEVNVDVKEIRIKFSDDTTDKGWTTLDTKAGIYNLLDFQDGQDTLIATGSVSSGTIQQIRAVLGTNNTIKVNGIVFPLTIPSGSESGLKLKINKKLDEPVENLILDFDAAASVHEDNGGYKLNPVIIIK